MIHFLKLIRYKNLLIVAATQYAILYCLIKPLIEKTYAPLLLPYRITLELQFSDLNFSLLVLATVLITAAGYIINDYFDRKTDFINHPDDVIVGKHISSRFAMTMHWIFNAVGVLLGIYISYQIDMLSLGMIFIFITGLLWYYSTTFNYQFLIGNLIISFLTALVPLFVGLFEIIPLNKVYAIHMRTIDLFFNKIIFWILAYSFFAFILTLIREIIKDMEDLEGDNAYGRNSVPIVIGMKYTKLVVSLLISGTISLIYFGLWSFVKYNIDNFVIIVSFITVFISLPLLFSGYKTLKGKTQKDFKTASTSIKIGMIGGLLLLGILYLILSGLL